MPVWADAVAVPALNLPGTAAALALVEEPVADDGASGEELYLEVILNQQADGQLARFVKRDNTFLASAATLRQLGLQWPGSDNASGLLALDQVAGLQYEYDIARQRMNLLAAPALLQRKTVLVTTPAPVAPQVDASTRAPGLVFNYDLFGQGQDGYRYLSGFSELRLFGVGRGVWSNTMSSRISQNTGLPRENHNVRLDSNWQWDLPDQMLSVVVGDNITGSLDWTRGLRIGGIHLGRNFSLQPYRTTTPLASFAGEAVLPSTVDLYINGLKQSSQEVRPGQFQIDSTPSLNGTGQAQLVITDINGQQRTLGFSLYGAPQLLQAGLSDWSLDAGVVRRDYGIRSFEYESSPIVSGTVRYGATDTLTLESHVEGGHGIRQAGVAGIWLISDRAGVINASLAASRGEGRHGYQHGLGYQWNSRLFSASYSTLRRSTGFADVATASGALMPRRTDQAYAGLNTIAGQWGVSYVLQDYPSHERSRFASLNWSRQLWHNSTLNLSINRDLENEDNSLFAYWSVPLDRYTQVSSSLRRSQGQQSAAIDAYHSINEQGGWGWRAQASVGDQRGGQAELNHLGDYGRWGVGASHLGSGGVTTIYGSASGGLLWMAGQGYAMRRVDDAFALVSTGVPGVPVKLENRLVGRTDANGLLLINRLNAWQNNQISIDPMQLPASLQVGSTLIQAVPETLSGMRVNFEIRNPLSLEFSVRNRQGEWVAAGTPIRLVGASTAEPPLTVVGMDGAVFLPDATDKPSLRIGQGDNTCTVEIPPSPQANGRVELGVLACQ